MSQDGELTVAINTDMLSRYYEYCEDLSNKYGGLALLDAAKENNGKVKIQYKSKYNCGRRYGEGPNPAYSDTSSRASAMYKTDQVDGDQVNSAIAIVYFIGIVLAISEYILDKIG